jgi:homeodomain-containing protein
MAISTGWFVSAVGFGMTATILYFHLFGSNSYHTCSPASYDPSLAIPQRSCGEQLHKNLMKIFKVSYKTMYNWLNRWEYEGMLGLYNKPGRGRKETFNSAQSAQIREWVKLQPKQLKQVVQKIKKEWSVNISTETIKRIIKKKG